MHCGFPERSVPKDSARCVQGCKHENLTAQGHSPFRVQTWITTDDIIFFTVTT